MAPAFRTLTPTNVKISKIVGLETYKALYSMWPHLYTYISDPLVPTTYFVSLVETVISNSGLSFEQAGVLINQILTDMVNEKEVSTDNAILVEPLLDSSYPIKNLRYTFWENVIWISVVVILSFWIIWYLYRVGFWSYVFNETICYDCMSVFDIFEF